MSVYPLPYEPKQLASKDVGIAYIGCGGAARNHARAARNLGLRLVACSDLSAEAAERFAKSFEIPEWYTDYNEMLALSDIDVVEVAIPPSGRVDVVQAIAESGRHIHIEKPFAHMYEDAVRMMELAQSNGVRLNVSQNTRYYKGARAAYELVRAGVLGELFYLEVRMFGNQERKVAKWYRNIDHFMLVEWGSHHFDVARFWAGRPPVRVSCISRRTPNQEYSSDMLQSTTLDFGGNLIGVVTTTNDSASDSFDYPIRLEGTRGALRGFMQGPLEICTEEDRTEWRPVDLSVLEQGPSPIESLLIDFLTSIADGSPSPQSGEDNLQTVATYVAAIRSKDEQNRWVDLAEVTGRSVTRGRSELERRAR